jgi:hypothetical protein
MHASEIDITDFFNGAAPMDYSASAAEIGQDAGRITWRAAYDDSPDWPLLQTDEQRDTFRRYVKGFGAWTQEEITAWSDTELNALLIQFVSGDIREMQALCGDNWAEYARLAERGTVCGRMGPGTDGRIYYSISD